MSAQGSILSAPDAPRTGSAHLNVATFSNPIAPSHTVPLPSPFSPNNMYTLRSGTKMLFSCTWKLKMKKAIDEVNSARGIKGAVGGRMGEVD